MTFALSAILPSATPLVLCAKGIERASGAFLCDVVGEMRPGSAIAVLSGPSFADDVARGLPTAVTLACANELAAAQTSNDAKAIFLDEEDAWTNSYFKAGTLKNNRRLMFFE